jgi:hypothetical protein
VTSNPHFQKSYFEDLVGRKPEEVFHEVFHTYRTDWDKQEKTILPEDVARDAQTAAKLFPQKNLILHFMQPHYPFLESDLEESGIRMVNGREGRTIWDRAENDEVEDERVWDAYRRNLEIVIKQVSDLDLEGKTIITADHGNLFGEGGLYGHPKGYYLEPLLKVPWYTTSDC